MTTVEIRPAHAAVPPLAIRARDVLTSEFTKLRSVRSTYWTLLIAVVTAIGLSAIVAVAFATAPPAGRPPIDPLLPSFISLEYAVLAVGVLGVLAFSSEHATGLIRTTFAAVPRRRAVLAAKAAAAGTVTLIVGELVSFASFFLVQAILSGHHLGVSLSHSGVPGAVLAEGTLLFVCAMVGLGLGAMIRHTAGAVAALVALIYLPAILGLLPAPWNDRIGRFTLFYAAQQVVAPHPRTDLLSPAPSMLVLLACLPDHPPGRVTPSSAPVRPTSRAVRAQGAQPIALDLLDARAVREAVLEAKPDAIVHEASALADGGFPGSSTAASPRPTGFGPRAPTHSSLGRARQACTASSPRASPPTATPGGDGQDRRRPARRRPARRHRRDVRCDGLPRPGGHRRWRDRAPLRRLLRQRQRPAT